MYVILFFIGFGKEYRNLLHKQWAVFDRDDIINAAKYLRDQRLVDSNKICIMGSSAGGLLVLSALIHSNIFSAAASLYCVSDLIDLQVIFVSEILISRH